MNELQVGQKVGKWQSNFGQADITVKKEIGTGYKTKLDAEKAVIKIKDQGVITKEADGKYHAYSIDDGANFDDLNLGEKITGKAKPVVDFVGDDKAAILEGEKIYLPTGKDNGKVVNVFFGYAKTLDKVIMRGPDRFFISDDIKRLQELGYTVKVDLNVTKKDFDDAVYDSRTAGVLWFGHGAEGGVVDVNENWIFPGFIDKNKVSKNLKMVVFEACQVGKMADDWKDQLNGADIIAWKKNVKNGAMQFFNSQSLSKKAYALDNLIEKNLGGEFAKTKHSP